MVSSESEPDSEPDMSEHATVLPTFEFVSETCTLSTFTVSSGRYEPKRYEPKMEQHKSSVSTYLFLAEYVLPLNSLTDILPSSHTTIAVGDDSYVLALVLSSATTVPATLLPDSSSKS